VIEGFLWGGLLQQTTDVENYPGYPEGVMGPEMMQQLRDQAERFGTRFITDNVTRIEPGAEGEPHTVWIEDDEYKARTVILAMGAEHKKLACPGEEELGGRGVSYCATCDAAFYKDKTTVIVGGGDSAMEEALFLAKFASHVTIVNRRDEFRASKIMLERARATENIEFLTPYTVDEFIAGGRAYLTRFAATMHFLGNMLIEVDGERARAETYAVAYHRVEGPDGGGKDDIFGIRYVDRFERRAGRWRIAHRVVATEWRRVDPVPVGKLRGHLGVWGTRDETDVVNWIMTATAPAA